MQPRGSLFNTCGSSLSPPWPLSQSAQARWYVPVHDLAAKAVPSDVSREARVGRHRAYSANSGRARLGLLPLCGKEARHGMNAIACERGRYSTDTQEDAELVQVKKVLTIGCTPARWRTVCPIKSPAPARQARGHHAFWRDASPRARTCVCRVLIVFGMQCHARWMRRRACVDV